MELVAMVETRGEEETMAWGSRVGKVSRPGLPLCLEGELGSGKTVFVRGFVQGALGRACTVTSPTFVLQNCYTKGDLTVYHIDAYRISGESEFMGSGLGESLQDPKGLVCIEWARRVGGVLGEERLIIELEHLDEEKRRLMFWACGNHAKEYLRLF